MYVNIGGNYAVSDKEIIGIMDIENTSTSKITREYLNRAEKEGRIVTLSYDLPRSYIITDDLVYISPVLTQTLIKRFGGKGIVK